MIRKYLIILMFILLSVHFPCLATAASQQQEVPVYVADFNYTPDSQVKPGSAGVTFAIGNVEYKSNSRTAWFSSAQFANLDKSLKKDLANMLTAKGFSVLGPFDSYDLIPYKDKKVIDLYLTPTVEISFTSKGPMGDDVRQVKEKAIGVIKVSGKITLELREVVTRELMWAKSIPFTFTFLAKERIVWGDGWSMDKINSGIEQPLRASDGNMLNNAAKVLEQRYPGLMSTIAGLIDPEEMLVIKGQCRQLKASKGYTVPTGPVQSQEATSGAAATHAPAAAAAPVGNVSDVSDWPGIDVKIKATGLFNAGHTIVSIVAGSPASRAGLTIGDQILKIDETGTGYMTAEQVMERLREAGPRMTLLIKRKGQEEAFPVLVTRIDAASAKSREAPVVAAVPTASAAPVTKPAPSLPKNSVSGTPTSPALVPTQGPDTFSGKVLWGLTDVGDNPEGPVILGVTPDWPMAKAGILAGDVVLAVDGSQVKTPADLKEKFKASRPYTPVKLLILRSGKRFEKTFLPTGAIKLELKEIDRNFIIPGVPAAGSRPSSVLDALDNINILKEVIIDPATGQVALVGGYDPRYATGPIAYLDLLKTALKYPEPVFELVPEGANIEAVTKYKDKNLHKVHLPALILAMPAAERERQLLIRQLAAEYGITPEEYIALYNFAHFQFIKDLAPPRIGRIIVKTFRHAGQDQAAAAYEKLEGRTADSYAQALKVLGWGTEAEKVLADTTKDKKQKEDKLLALAAIAIMRKIGLFAPGDEATLKAGVESGENRAPQKLAVLYNYAPIRMKDSSGRVLAMEAMARIPVGDAPTRVLCGIDNSPIYVRIETEHCDPDSGLARILYEADYAGKTFLLRPELFDKVPGQITYSEYLTRKLKGMKIGHLTLDAKFWFEPKRVEMRVSPDKKVVSFGKSEIRFTTQMDEMRASSKEELKSLFTFYNDWCAQYTDKYEEYARIVPAFHKLRETAKVIALAKWLNSEHIAVNLESVQQERWERPAKITGAWRYGTSSSEEAPGNFTYPVFNAITGGVTFKLTKRWTAVESAPQVETGLKDQLRLSNMLGEKAADAARIGNLEEARYLSEMSAQALTGGITRADLIKLKVPVADPVELPASPQAILLQKEIIKETHEQIAALEKNPASRESATAALSRIKNLYGQVRQDPVRASDYLRQMQTGQLSAAAAPVTKPAAAPAPTVSSGVGVDELQLRQALLGNLADTIAKRTSGTNPAVQEIIRSLKTKKPPELESLTKNISDLAPGDVMLIAPVLAKDWQKAGARDVLISNAVNLLDRWGSNCWSSPASHAAVFLGERNGKRWYMDNASEHGPVIKEERQFLKEYGERRMDVATLVGEPLSPAEAEAIFKAAHELRDAGIKYGIGSDKRMVCSEAARWLVMQTGRDIPGTESQPAEVNLLVPFLQKKDLVSYSPADFYKNREYFVIRPLDIKRK